MTRQERTRTPLLDRLFAGHHDVLAALRSLRRSPGFVAIAVISLGLAIGLYTTTFALLDAIRRPYVPYTNPGELYDVEFNAQAKDLVVLEREMYLAFRPRHDLYGAMAPMMFLMGGSVIDADGQLIPGHGYRVGTGFFDILGVKPLLGRTFDMTHDDPADADAVVISYQLWHEHLGENRHLEQLKLSFNDRRYTVIGVMPPGMDYGGDLWFPMAKAVERSAQGPGPVAALIRLRSGESPARVRAELKALGAQFTAAHHAEGALFDFRLGSLAPAAGSVGGFPLAVAAATTLVLLIACLNLANLMLARGLARRREIAVRMAIGASRAAIIRYVLTECAVLASLGGAWGILASVWGVRLAESRMPSRIASLGLVPPRLDWRVLAFGIGITALTVLVAGALPAVHAARANVNEAMKDGGAGSTGHRSHAYRLVVVAEIALALFVTMGSTFSLQLLQHDAGFQFGYDADHQLYAFVSPGRSCPASDSLSHFWSDMARRAASVPGVRYAALSLRTNSQMSTLTSDQPGTPIQIILGEGRQLGYELVTPDYFRVFGYPIVAGRDFEPGDAEGAGAAIVNRKTARRLWPFTSPVGRLVKLGPARSGAPWVPVVGVVGPRSTGVGDSTVNATPDLTIVRPLPCKAVEMYARTRGDPNGPAVALYHTVRAAMPTGGIVSAFSSPRAEFEQNLRVTLLVALLFAAFGVFVLVLSAIGVYGVLNYAVGQRIRELAMRSALGAREADLRNIVLKDALEMVLGGTAVGATTALMLGHGLAGSGSVGAITLIATESVVILVSLAACVVPVRRAVGADPVELLRAT